MDELLIYHECGSSEGGGCTTKESDVTIQAFPLCRYKCATFGQQFEHDNGTFYDHFSIVCQDDQTWSASTIPHQCSCELFKFLHCETFFRVQVCQPA